MSEDSSISEPVPQPQTDGPSAGMLLRAAREANGLHIAALAVAMKVPVKKLESLEADRLDELPDAVFVRALAASMCRALKIDPAPVLSKLPQSVAPKLDKGERGVNMPYRAPGFHYGDSLQSFFARPAVVLVLVLLLAALAVVFFPEVSTVGSKAVDTTPPAAPTETGSQADKQSPDAQPLADRNQVAMGSSQPQLAASADALPVALPATAASGVAAALAKPAPPSPSAPAVADVVVFKAKASAWIRVNDSSGAVQLEKTLAAGETAAASGSLPLAVVIGNVAATEVMVRGQPFVMDAVAKDNVARFEVK
jgi:cytoskeleton protein RodZ